MMEPVESISGGVDAGKPLLKLKKFKVCLCPYCKTIQVTEAEERLVCKGEGCGKSSVFRSNGVWNILLVQSDFSAKANDFCGYWKLDLFEFGVSPVKEVAERYRLFKLKNEIKIKEDVHYEGEGY
jgi:hypothetical protein